jgi:hypothetical protein
LGSTWTSSLSVVVAKPPPPPRQLHKIIVPFRYPHLHHHPMLRSIR